MSKYGVFSGLNTGKYGLEKTPYLDTFRTVTDFTHCFGVTIIVVDQVNVADWNSC